MSEHRPGDIILNRYMPHASPEEREAARANLCALADLILRVEERLAREWHDTQIREHEAREVESDQG